MEALVWFTIGVAAAVFAVILGGMIAVAIGLADSPLSDSHYVD